MPDSTLRTARTGEAKLLRQMEQVATAKSDISNVAVFTKLIKKAEDIAQSAV
jgi:hypothetical protein